MNFLGRLVGRGHEEDATPLMTLSRTATRESELEDGEGSDAGETSSSQDGGSLSNGADGNLRRRSGGIASKDFDEDEADMSVDEGAAYYSPEPRHRRPWRLLCCATCGFVLFALLLFVNIVFFLHYYWYHEDDPDHIFDNWGRPGTGTEGLAWYPTDFLRDVVPIACHSHNDYWRKVPLFSALHAGCIGVEADVWLFDGELYVGHDTASLTRNRTFQALYVNPIADILGRVNPKTDFYNGTSNGVFDTVPDQTLTLLVDFKTDGHDTFPYVLRQLEPLRKRGWLTTVSEDGTVKPGPVTVVGTGNTPFDLVLSTSGPREILFDAPLSDMWEPPWESHSGGGKHEGEGEGGGHKGVEGDGASWRPGPTTYNYTNSYYASTAFGSAIGSVWRGRLSQVQLDKMRGQIRGAHRRGLKARYWDLPAWPIGVRNYVWDMLVREGVDLLNVDDLKGASQMDWRTGKIW